MIKRISAFAISGLLVTGFAIALYRNAKSAARAPIDSIVRAHNVSPAPGIPAVFVATARRVTYRHTNSENGAPPSFERRETVAYNGSAFIHDQSDPQGVLEQIDLLEKGKVYRTEIAEGRRTKTAAQLGGLDYESARFRTMAFGLIPVLEQLREPTVEAGVAHPTEAGPEVLKVKTSTDTWTVYVDQGRRIQKIERGRNRHTLAIEYLDYRLVGGAQLPFTERVFVDGRLTQELFFTRIDLAPSFSEDQFSVEWLAKAGARTSGSK
jgi:hypothetical protein